MSKKLGKMIKDARMDRGLSQAALAESAGVSASEIAEFQFCPQIGVPMSDKQGDEFSGLRMTKYGKSGMLKPSELLADIVLSGGVSRQLR